MLVNRHSKRTIIPKQGGRVIIVYHQIIHYAAGKLTEVKAACFATRSSVLQPPQAPSIDSPMSVLWLWLWWLWSSSEPNDARKRRANITDGVDVWKMM